MIQATTTLTFTALARDRPSYDEGDARLESTSIWQYA